MMSLILEELTIDKILHSLNEKWGDGRFYDYEFFPNSNAKYSHSNHYKLMIDQLVKEKFVEKKGGRCTGGLYVRNFTIRNGKYSHLLLRITSKGHQYALNQKAKEENNKNTPNQSISQNIQNDSVSVNKMELKEYIGKGKHKKAIDKIKSILIECKNETIMNELIMVESQLTRIEKDRTTGTESRDDIDLRLNKVSKGLLTIIDSIE